MEVRFLPNQESYRRMTTGELRSAFVLDSLFAPGKITMTYCDADRAIIGGAMPSGAPLRLEGSKKEMAAEYFAERRELGIVNLGGEGAVRVDGSVHSLKKKDMLYVGRGAKSVEFMGEGKNSPAFYFVSFPAHASHPTALVPAAEAENATIGTAEGASKRTIRKYIHENGAKSCQLVMGLTNLDSGSVWNTMPPHTHLRRMEVYLYFDLGPDDVVVHLMGRPDETRNLILRNREAVISPVWSIHCGAASRNYSFVWAMGGENKDFADMDPVAPKELL